MSSDWVGGESIHTYKCKLRSESLHLTNGFCHTDSTGIYVSNINHYQPLQGAKLLDLSKFRASNI